MWRINDLCDNVAAHPAERLSVVALDHLPAIRERARRLLDANRDVLNAFVRSRPELEMPEHRFGTVAFPRLKRGRTDDLCARLRDRYDTTVVPGSFFEMPEHFRVGIGGDTKLLRQGLERVRKALDEL